MKKGLQFRISNRQKLSRRLILAAFSFALLGGGAVFFWLNMGQSEEAKASTEVFPVGSYIINMGVTPQTGANALRPYGLVYDLIENYQVPVHWIIEPSKARDGVDFTYNSVNYKGGPFIISGDYMTPTVQARIAYWNSLGVQGVYATNTFSAPVYATLQYYPRIVIDTIAGNQSIIQAYFNNAMIPSTAYRMGTPNTVGTCDDIWVNPHGDPMWSTHGNLHTFATTQRGYIWSECHAVSMLEAVYNTSNPAQNLRFLSTNSLQCWKNSGCQSPVSEYHAKPAPSPVNYFAPADPVMQFLGDMHGACDAGSEQWFKPLTTSAWRSTTTAAVTVGTSSAGQEGTVLVYGPAFGDPTMGWVAYTGGHDLNASGDTLNKIAAQRAFHNFMLLAGKQRPSMQAGADIPSTITSGWPHPVAAWVDSGIPPYTYQWTSSIPGVFSNSTDDSTQFTPTYSASPQNGTITVTITDFCGRTFFSNRPIYVAGGVLPVSLISFNGRAEKEKVILNWVTASEKNNDFFTIARSFDGSNFQEVIKVSGSGTTNVRKYYSAVDEPGAGGTIYYRLTQTDFNGDRKSFNPIRVSMSSENFTTQIKVYPNPVSANSTVSFSSEQPGEVDILVSNLMGQQIIRRSFGTNPGTNTVFMPEFADLPTGRYQVIMMRDGKRISSASVIRN